MSGLKIFVLGTRGFPGVQGGVEKHGEQLYPRLAKLGCDVTVFTRTPYIPPKKRLAEWKEVKFIHLWCPHLKSLEAITHTFLGVLISRLKTPDILHIHAVGPSLLVPIAKMLGIKIVFTHHGPDYQRKKWGRFAKMMLKTGESLGIKFADKVIVISKWIKNNIENTYLRKDLKFIPNGVHVPKIVAPGDTLKKYDLEPRKYIFTVSRFVPEKGSHDLISSYLKIKNPVFKLVIAGYADHPTRYSRYLEELAQESQNIILTGFLSGKPLGELYSNAGLFVLPSYYEGLPIVLLEALSYRLPVLVSNIPANREILLPDFRYFPSGNVAELKKKIIKLFNTGINEEERAQQRELLEKNYNWDEIAKKVFTIYREMA